MRRGAPRRRRRPIRERVPRAVIGLPEALLWARREHRRLAGTLTEDGVRASVLGPPPLAPFAATRLVCAVLRVRRATCLERSLILQAWLAAHGMRRDVVIGVRRDGDVKAHAWLDGVEDSRGFEELHRVPR